MTVQYFLFSAMMLVITLNGIMLGVWSLAEISKRAVNAWRNWE